jgi:hypothetical protein
MIFPLIRLETRDEIQIGDVLYQTSRRSQLMKGAKHEN